MEQIQELYQAQFWNVSPERRLRVIGMLRRLLGRRTQPQDLVIFNVAVEVAATDEPNRQFYTVFTETWFRFAVINYNNTTGDTTARMETVEWNTWDDSIGAIISMGWYAYLCGDSIRFSQDCAAAA